jgi:hypothetical protein
MTSGFEQPEAINSIIPRIQGLSLAANQRIINEINQTINFMSDQNSIPALISLLDDNEYDVRWIAAESLINIGRKSVIPLLKSIKGGRSTYTPGRGAYHVLHSLLSKKEQRAIQHLMSAKIIK